VMQLWKRLLTRHYDYVGSDHINVAAALYPLKFSNPYRVWLCGIEVFPPNPTFEGRLGLLGATQRIAISDFTARTVAKQFPNLSIDVCDLGLDPIRHNFSVPDLSAELSLSTVIGTQVSLGNSCILHVGTMDSTQQYKGQDVLIQAMPHIIANYPDTQLVLAGRGDDLPRLHNLACSLPEIVQRAIFIPGFVSDEQLRQLYARCFAFAMPSRGEGFGLVYIEAMQYGKPCIGSTVDAAGSIIQNGYTGLLVSNPTSPEDVASCIITLLADPNQARKMGQAGAKRVQEYYSFPYFKERFWSILQTK